MRNRKAILSQPARQRFRLVPDITRPYANCIGRRLHECERRIVHALELKRLADQPARFLIVDQSPLYDSRRAIIRYVDWVARGCYHTPILVMPSVKKGKDFLDGAPLNRKPVVFGARRADALRGRTFNHAIITDAKPKSTATALQAIAPVLSIGNFSVLVVQYRGKKKLKLPPSFEVAPPAPDVGVFDESEPPGIAIIELVQLPNPSQNSQNSQPSQETPITPGALPT